MTSDDQKHRDGIVRQSKDTLAMMAAKIRGAGGRTDDRVFLVLDTSGPVEQTVAALIKQHLLRSTDPSLDPGTAQFFCAPAAEDVANFLRRGGFEDVAADVVGKLRPVGTLRVLAFAREHVSLHDVPLSEVPRLGKA